MIVLWASSISIEASESANNDGCGDDDDDYCPGEAELEYESTEPSLKRLKLKRVFLNRPYLRSQIQYAPKAPKEVESELESVYRAKSVVIPTQRSIGKYMELRGAVQKKQELERLAKQKEQLRRMIGFRFKRHPSLNFSEEHLQVLEKVLEGRVRQLLAIPTRGKSKKN